MKNTFSLSKIESPYKIYEGIESRVQTTKDSHFGVISNEDIEYLYLKPHLVYENLPKSKQSWKQIPRIEMKIPKAIKKAFIESIDPLEEGYITNLVTKILETAKTE